LGAPTSCHGFACILRALNQLDLGKQDLGKQDLGKQDLGKQDAMRADERLAHFRNPLADD
jgi:hypothetical protein